jgi:predicted nucleotidyltransferase
MSNKKKIIEKVIIILKKHDAREIAIFGSYAKEKIRPESDLDILVEFSRRKSLLDLVSIEIELEEMLNMKIDLLTKKSISPYLIDRIEREAERIYG